MSEAMHDEFDTVAGWTADVALDLGPTTHEPAGCRGSGGPHTLDTLLDRIDRAPGDVLLDVGAGAGGPAAYAARTRGVRPVLLEPEPGACRAARRLFRLPVAQASATDLPVADDAVTAAWSVGVLCTVRDKRAALTELRRVVRPGGRIGLLVYEAQHDLPEQPDGNSFPTADSLAADIDATGLQVTWRGEMVPMSKESHEWRDASGAVDIELERRHGSEDGWRTAKEQAATIGRLLRDGHLVGRLLVLR